VLRTEPTNEIRGMPSRSTLIRTHVFGALSLLCAVSTAFSTTSTGLFATLSVGSLVAAIIAVPGGVELLAREVRR